MQRIFRLGIAATVAVSMVSCSDNLQYGADDRFDDGSVRFTAYDGASVANTSGPTRSYNSGMPIRPVALRASHSVQVASGADSLWVNAAFVADHSLKACVEADTDTGLPTRGMPLEKSCLDSFLLTAVSDGKTFIANEEAVLNNPASGYAGCWSTDHTYYWPQSEVEFYAFAKNGAITPAQSTMQGGTIKFDYEVPKSTDGKHDADVQTDLALATLTTSRNGADVESGRAKLHFHHPFAGIVLMKDASVNSLNIESVTINGVYGKGHCEFNGKYNSPSTQSTWSVAADTKTNYTQAVGSEPVKVKIGTETEVEALCQPFIIIPQTQATLSEATITVRMADGVVRTVPLSGFTQGFEPGTIYTLTLSKRPDDYKPVEKLQSAVGNNTVSLTWDYPALDEVKYPHIHQIGVTVNITQKRKLADGTFESQTLTESFRWDDWQHTYPSTLRELDTFANLTGGADPSDPSHAVTLNTARYTDFVCTVIADYVNEFDGTRTIVQSDPATVELKSTITSSDVIAFFVPNNGDTSDPVAALLDDDDKAAAAWFSRAFEKCVFVNASNFEEMRNLYGFNTLWFPCGVKLTGGDPGDSDIADATNILKSATGVSGDYGNYVNNLAPVFDRIKTCRGLYNDPTGGISRISGDYLTEADIQTIHDFYRGSADRRGGNLLLTSFAIEKIYELGVITDNCDRNKRGEFTPFFRLFNEVKQPAIWFVNPTFAGRAEASHPIYAGLFQVGPETFPDYLEDYNHYYENHLPDWPLCDGDKWFEIWNDKGIMIADAPRIVVGIRGIPMFPLLSRDARTCENNNIIWDFNNQEGKSMADMEDNTNCRFLGTWGQLDNADIGVAVEFYPGPTDNRAENNHTHGRCICIGLGAYEFNNGTRYDASEEATVMNRYQSNVQMLTKNALEYLNRAPYDRK